jgi:hypothetical protein
MFGWLRRLIEWLSQVIPHILKHDGHDLNVQEHFLSL